MEDCRKQKRTVKGGYKMKLIIIRHGDPDYEIDSLTEKGWREAALLSEKMKNIPADAYYVSVLGRAKDTASFTLKEVGKEAKEFTWLQEFPARIDRPDNTEQKMIAWDWLPTDWLKEDRYLQYDHWYDTDVMKGDQVKEQYLEITKQFDALLASHGYIREGRWYRAERSNHDTLVFFCHFGLECILISHLLHISPMILWHGVCAAPTSVTTLVTEERRKGTAVFRMTSFGDISHLYVAGEEPAFAARFSECFEDENGRID